MAKSKTDANGKKVSQRKMVLTSLEAKGWDAKPAELKVFINDEFGADLPTNVISTYKSQLRKENGKGGAGRRGRKGGAKFSDLETVRGLVLRLGAGQVRDLVEMADSLA